MKKDKKKANNMYCPKCKEIQGTTTNKYGITTCMVCGKILHVDDKKKT
jgi:ribosomal protein S27E